MKNSSQDFDFIKNMKEDRPVEFGVNRKTPDRLIFTERISPIKIERLFRYVLKELGYLKEKKTDESAVLNNFLEETESKRIDECITNSILFSFKFNKKKHNKYRYLDSVQESRYDHKGMSNFFIGDTDPIIDFLNIEGLDEIRNLLLYIQSKGKFKNFSENKLSEILTYNFQTLNNNNSNSLYRNRQFVKNLRRRKETTNSIYYCDFKILKKSVINQYL